MGSKGLLCVLLVLAVAAGGCAYEKMIAVSSDTPPWVLQRPASTDEGIPYVGQGLGDNIVDTREARSRAMQDVRNQIAESLRMRVVDQAIEIVEQKDVAHLARDQERALHSGQVEQHVNEAMSGVQQDAFYWEKWMIKDGFFSPAYSRYKYYILAGMPKELQDKLMTELSHKIADDIEARGQQAPPEAPSAGEATPSP